MGCSTWLVRAQGSKNPDSNGRIDREIHTHPRVTASRLVYCADEQWPVSHATEPEDAVALLVVDGFC